MKLIEIKKGAKSSCVCL